MSTPKAQKGSSSTSAVCIVLTADGKLVEMSTIAKAPVDRNGNECHSVHHHCARKWGRDGNDPSSLGPWRYDEFAVYNDGLKQQMNFEWLIIYRRVKPKLKSYLFACKVKDGQSWHACQLHLKTFQIEIVKSGLAPTTERGAYVSLA